MLQTRNLRLVVTFVALVTIIGLIFSSHASIGEQIQKVTEKTGDSVPPVIQDPKNTLQGKPHKGTEAPYSADKVTGAGKAPGKGSKDSSKLKPGKSSGAGSGTKPVIVADVSDSEKNHANKNQPGSSSVGDGNGGLVDGTNKALEDEDTPTDKKASGKSQGKASAGGAGDKEYVVMIDAGSTGSRVHVYEFDTSVSPPRLLNEVFKMKKPGLSSFDTDTVGAAKSLDELLDTALESVPKEKQSCTPVAVKATAGLRLLGEKKAANILDEVRTHLENDYPFAVVDGDGISIMEGKDEGVYAWVTANYLLGNIGSAEKNPTAAVFDLGGGSTQIVFEPQFKNEDAMAPGDHKYDLSFGNNKFTLYQHSHLGYGLMQGRNKVNGLIVQDALKTNKELQAAKLAKADVKEAKASVTLTNPCIPPGVVAEDVDVELGEGEFYKVNMKGPEKDANVHTGAQCRFLAEKVLNKELECLEKPCSFNGAYQPSLTKSFSQNSDMYVFSYFYDRTNPLGFPTSFTVGELSELAKVVCGGDNLWSSVLLDDHVKELNEEPQWCLDLSFITAMLHTGYDIPLHRELRTAKTIDNNELGWCLGASLPLLDKSSGWTCSVKDVTNES